VRPNGKLSYRPVRPAALHIICERDVGLFNLILSVIPQVKWALCDQRIPIVYYGERSSYWTPRGYHGRATVWEYYFEPVIPKYPVSSIPLHIRELISRKPPDQNQLGHFVDEFTFISNRPTSHIPFDGECIKDFIDPSDRLRQKASSIIRDYIRPRGYLAHKAERFFREHLAGRYVIGVHIRGTDALVDPNRVLDKGGINFRRYFAIVEELLCAQPDARIFVASDAQSSVDQMRKRFGNRVIAYDSIRHQSGDLAGRGPTGGLMPAYLTHDRDCAARSGEEAVIEYVLLCRCDTLVHNGASLSRAVLLTVPGLPASGTISKLTHMHHVVWRASAPLRRTGQIWRGRAAAVYTAISGKPISNWYHLLRELWITKRAARRETS
jgi:hypothetical protein